MASVIIASLLTALAFTAAADGDTLTLRSEQGRIVVRLAEVDSPEHGQEFWQAARRNLTALCVNAKDIRVEPTGKDRYGRTVAHVFCDGVDVNWRQVSDGFAWCFPKYLKHPDECLPLEREARDAKRGLWSAPAVAPWDWREGRHSP